VGLGSGPLSDGDTSSLEHLNYILRQAGFFQIIDVFEGAIAVSEFDDLAGFGGIQTRNAGQLFFTNGVQIDIHHFVFLLSKKLRPGPVS
jgi:hypothetical protein